MEYEILVEGDHVRLVSRKVEKTVPVKAFLSSLVAHQKITTPILPMGCKLMQSDPKTGSETYVIEAPPKMARITYRSTELLLSFPFVQFYVQFARSGKIPGFIGMSISCTKSPLLDIDQPVYILPVPNQHVRGNGFMCTGGIKTKATKIPIMVSEIISGFYGAPFNDDLDMVYPEILGGSCTHLSALRAWHKGSKANPLFGMGSTITYLPKDKGGTCRSELAKFVRN